MTTGALLCVERSTLTGIALTSRQTTAIGLNMPGQIMYSLWACWLTEIRPVPNAADPDITDITDITGNVSVYQ